MAHLMNRNACGGRAPQIHRRRAHQARAGDPLYQNIKRHPNTVKSITSFRYIVRSPRCNRNIIIVLGFIGPVFWPYAYDDFVEYTFWGYGYDTFWPYAFDDFYEGIYGAYAPNSTPEPATRVAMRGGARRHRATIRARGAGVRARPR
jgi:hypothetical protein